MQLEYNCINTNYINMVGADDMVHTFLFSKAHLIVLLILALFLYFCPRLTKNLLPYSYMIEKILCLLIFLEIFFEQASIMYLGDYNTLTSLPISISRFSAYMCIAILFFKQYQLFNVFFSWGLVSAIGELIFFEELPYVFPSTEHIFYIASKFFLIYAVVYMCEVRKFKVNKYAIKDNLLMCTLYFSFIFLLDSLTTANYTYSFSSNNIASIFIFVGITTIMYIPSLIFNKDDYDKFNFSFKKKR
ncbi:TMEM164 family acyltransferase [Romboutsia weinsteinii]